MEAGQAACMLSDPDLRETLQWSSEDTRGKTVASRLKDLISGEGKGSFQRVPREKMFDPASAWGQVHKSHHLISNLGTD